MKKLFLAMSVFTLTIFTSCTNDTNEVAPVQQEKTINKTMSKAGDELQKNTTEQTKAIELVKEFADAEMTGRPAMPTEPIGAGYIITCHTPYENSAGSACVTVGGYTVSVTWVSCDIPILIQGDNGIISHCPRTYTGTVVSSCAC